MENRQMQSQVDSVNLKRRNKKLVVVIVVLAVVVTLAVLTALTLRFGKLGLGDSKVERTVLEASSVECEPCGDYPFTSLRKVVYADVDDKYDDKGVSELRIMRNEIYARHGYIFNGEDMYRHFSSKSWYKPVAKEVVLSEIEKYNVEYLKYVEDVCRGVIKFDGEMPWYEFCCVDDVSCRKWTYEDLKDYDLQMLRLIRNWPYARHGYIFDSEDLRVEFSYVWWYRPVTKNVELTEIEKYNVALIKRYEKEVFGVAN